MKIALEKLLAEEKFFVEEIHRLAFFPESISFYPECVVEKDGNGWIYMAGEDGSADWNLARLVGDEVVAKNYVNLLPQNELQLLVTNEVASCFAGFETAGKILWFESQPEINSCARTIDLKFELQHGLKLLEKKKPEVCTIYPSENLTLLLIRDEQVAGIVKTIRETPRFVEVYIEISPDLRSQGVGTNLLISMIERIHVAGKRLLYAVDEENKASISIALKAGLVEFLSLTRLVAKT